MAFLTKKETSLINIVNANDALTGAQKIKVITEVKENARLRQDRYRPAVKIFLSVISNHQTSKLFNKIVG